MADLVERLGYHHEHPVTGKLVLTNPDGPEAATEIERQRAIIAAHPAEVERAREEERRERPITIDQLKETARFIKGAD